MSTPHIGLIGLSPMGYNLAHNIYSSGITLSVYNRTSSKTQHLQQDIESNKKNSSQENQIYYTYTIQEFIKSLPSKKYIFLIVTNTATPLIIKQLLPYLTKDDVICDFANGSVEECIFNVQLINNHFLEAERNQKMEKKESGKQENHSHNRENNLKTTPIDQLDQITIKYLTIGISGGTTGARKNGGLMISGHKDSYLSLESVFEKLTNSFFYFNDVYFTGHFIKYLHNGIEYSLMGVLSEYDEIMRCYNSSNENNKLHYTFNSYLSAILSKITKNSIFPSIKPILKMKGSGQWVFDQFYKEYDISMLSNSINQRVWFEKDSKIEQINQEEYSRHADEDENIDHTEFDSAFNNTLIYSLKLCYRQLLAVLEKDTTFIKKDENRKELVKNTLNIWKNGCIISSDVIDFLLKELEQKNQEEEKTNSNTLISDFKQIIKYALKNTIPIQQINTAYNTILRSNKKEYDQVRVLCGMRDYFGEHGVYVEGKEEKVNVDWK